MPHPRPRRTYHCSDHETHGSKQHAEDEILDATAAPNVVQTEFRGGEGIDADEPEDELVDAAERSSPIFGALSVKDLSNILARGKELEAALRPGRKREELNQMMAFDDLFHAVLHKPAPNNDVQLGQLQRNYGFSTALLAAALGTQEAIMKHMKRSATSQGDELAVDVEATVRDAVLQSAAAPTRM
jgi:hypothetical protein